MNNRKWYEAKVEIAIVALPLIKDLRVKRSGYPGELLREMGDHKLADQRWEEILKDIEDALRIVVDGDEPEDYEYEYHKKSLELFGKWFLDLWD